MKASEIPPEMACQFLSQIVDRHEAWKQRNPFSRCIVTIPLTREQAGMMWAGMRWLEAHENWGVGIVDDDPPLRQVIRFLSAETEKLKAMPEGELALVLSMEGMTLLAAAAHRLNNYAILRSMPEEKNWGRKKK